MNDKVSLYLTDASNPSTAYDVLFIVKENHPPLIRGKSEVETTAFYSQTIQLSITEIDGESIDTVSVTLDDGSSLP